MNIVERLLKAEPAMLERGEEKEMEIKRLSGLFGEPFLIRYKEIPGERYTELVGKMVDEKGKADFSRVHETHVLVVTAGVTTPDLKDKELLDHFKCSTPKELAEKLFNGGEIASISDAITELSGYGKGSDDEIKN